MELSSLYITGYAGLIAVFAGAVFQVAKYMLSRKTEAREQGHEQRADAASFLTVQQNALNAERDENSRLRDRVDELTKLVDDLRFDIDKQRREHERELEAIRQESEAEVTQLRNQLMSAIIRLDQLQANIRPPETNGGAAKHG